LLAFGNVEVVDLNDPSKKAKPSYPKLALMYSPSTMLLESYSNGALIGVTLFEENINFLSLNHH
jgi:hypothetical protein